MTTMLLLFMMFLMNLMELTDIEELNKLYCFNTLLMNTKCGAENSDFKFL